MGDTEGLKPEALGELEAIFGRERLLTSPEDLLLYSYDGTWVESMPGAVVFPLSAEEVSQVLILANRECLPVTPRGAGTGLSGGSVPAGGGLVLNLTRMDKILEIDTENMVAVVQPGVITADLQQAVDRLGLLYPPDPASLNQSTLGGNVAEDAGGARALKYGVTRNYVLALQVVLPTGQTIRTGSKALKNATGYNLCHLFIGSEGTLGVITEITLRLLPKPEARGTVLASYLHLAEACDTVSRILKAGIIPLTTELMDREAIQCVEDYLHIDLPRQAEALLLIDVDGHQEVVDKELGQVAQVCRAAGAFQVEQAATEEASDDLWRGRRAISGAITQVWPSKVGEDISVPRSAIPAIASRIREISRQYDLPIVLFGHIGDGNLHPNILYDRRDAEMVRRVEAAIEAIFRAAVELGGTLSGEHGVGLLKKPYLALDLDPGAIEAMKALKRALDPNDILNPDKIFP